MNVIDKLFAAGDGPSAIARRLGVRQSVVSNWRYRNSVPIERCIVLEAMTGISRYELRPDIFGAAPPVQE